MGYKFISLGQVSFLSSRPLYLTHYSITPLGCMTGTSDLTYLKQNSCYTALPSNPTFLIIVPVPDCQGIPLLFTYPIHTVYQQVLLTLLSENILSLFTPIYLL